MNRCQMGSIEQVNRLIDENKTNIIEALIPGAILQDEPDAETLTEVAIANLPASLVESAIASNTQYPMPNTQYPVPPAIAIGNRVVVTESDKGYFMQQGVVAYKETTPEIDGWRVQLDDSDYAIFTSNQIAPITLSDMDCQVPSPSIKEYEPMSLLEIEAAGGDVNEFVGLEVEVRSLSGKLKFIGTLTKFDAKNYFVKVAAEYGEHICDLRETWVH
jgi:hypothetical protein